MSIIKEFQESMICERCGKIINSTGTDTNVCHGCDRHVCNKCRIGPVCLDCMEKVNPKKQTLIKILHRIRMLAMYTMVICLLLVVLCIILTWDNSILISSGIGMAVSTVVFILFRALTYGMVQKSIGKKIE